ncbi:MAG: bifunctional phosphopantothenoylcysteine decarboxylase/phosphopantothenate--cysteine ligase CoaBC [Deltaproteobacteria bacterium]|nr:bifunctional phosphopantothenoylcysteine decarboxylase/phosphopantothenate--cysteine ligase CoaBC [Deltaproteobacteria bacterium]
MLTGKNIVLGVTGSIAAYKAANLARMLMEGGAIVWPILTESATRFIGPLTFSALTGNRTVTDMWSAAMAYEIGHVEFAHKADVMLVAPASADVIACMAAGRADEPLTAVALAMRAPIIVAPAMEEGMWLNAATQTNIATLRSRGVRIVNPGSGHLASGRFGVGRLAELEDIYESVLAALIPQDLAGQRIVISAGPTREFFDPARFISNPSSGKMGYALAVQAQRRGAEVVLITGPVALTPPTGVQVIQVVTTNEMLEACLKALPGTKALIMAAAPADYKPSQREHHKCKKSEMGDRVKIELESNPDILSTLAPRAKGVVTVGFAAESRDLIKQAQQKLIAKDLDYIIANDISRSDVGFATDENVVVIIDRNGDKVSLPILPKGQIANVILDKVAQMLIAEH